MVDEEPQRVVAGRTADQVVVVQHQHQLGAIGSQLVEQLGQDGLGQDVGRTRALEHAERGLPDAGDDDPERLDDVDPESHRVVVALIQRHPGNALGCLVGQAPLGQQRGLPRSGGGVDQAESSLRSGLQQLVEPGPRDQHGADRWWAQLGPQQDRPLGRRMLF
jgi:hypothetical protein